MICHQCLIKWVEGGSLYDTRRGGRYYVSEVDDSGTEYIAFPSKAETVLNGEALCMFHIKTVWHDILFAFDLQEQWYP